MRSQHSHTYFKVVEALSPIQSISPELLKSVVDQFEKAFENGFAVEGPKLRLWLIELLSKYFNSEKQDHANVVIALALRDVLWLLARYYPTAQPLTLDAKYHIPTITGHIFDIKYLVDDYQKIDKRFAIVSTGKRVVLQNPLTGDAFHPFDVLNILSFAQAHQLPMLAVEWDTRPLVEGYRKKLQDNLKDEKQKDDLVRKYLAWCAFGYLLLHVAAKYNVVNVLKIAVQSNIPLNQMDENNQTLLHVAARYNRPAIIKEVFVLCQPCEVKQPSADHWFLTCWLNSAKKSPLNIAEEFRHQEAKQLLLETVINAEKDTVLHHAVRTGDHGLVKAAIAQARQRNNRGETPLHELFEAKVINLQLLEEFFFDPNLCQEISCLAVLYYLPEVIRLLSVANVDLHQALFLAVRQNDEDLRLMQAITECKVNVDLIVNPDKKETVLHYAVKNFCDHSVSHLLKCGANPNLANSDQETVLHLIMQRVDQNDDELIQLLLDAKADPMQVNTKQLTPLMLAVFLQKFSSAFLLIKFYIKQKRFAHLVAELLMLDPKKIFQHDANKKLLLQHHKELREAFNKTLSEHPQQKAGWVYHTVDVRNALGVIFYAEGKGYFFQRKISMIDELKKTYADNISRQKNLEKEVLQKSVDHKEFQPVGINKITDEKHEPKGATELKGISFDVQCKKNSADGVGEVKFFGHTPKNLKDILNNINQFNRCGMRDEKTLANQGIFPVNYLCEDPDTKTAVLQLLGRREQQQDRLAFSNMPDMAGIPTFFVMPVLHQLADRLQKHLEVVKRNSATPLAQKGGSTGAMVFVSGDSILTSNRGDGAVFMVIFDSNNQIIKFARLNRVRHDASLVFQSDRILNSEERQEKERIKAVSYEDCGKSSSNKRIARLHNGLMVTKAFGDNKFIPFGLLHLSDIYCDKFYIPAGGKGYIINFCDGVLERLTEIQLKELIQQHAALSKIQLLEALGKAVLLSGSKDNISIMISQLQMSPMPWMMALFDGHATDEVSDELSCQVVPFAQLLFHDAKLQWQKFKAFYEIPLFRSAMEEIFQFKLGHPNLDREKYVAELNNLHGFLTVAENALTIPQRFFPLQLSGYDRWIFYQLECMVIQMVQLYFDAEHSVEAMFKFYKKIISIFHLFAEQESPIFHAQSKILIKKIEMLFPEMLLTKRLNMENNNENASDPLLAKMHQRHPGRK